MAALSQENNKLHVSLKAAELQLAEARSVSDVAKKQTDTLKKSIHDTKETILKQQIEIGRLHSDVDSYTDQISSTESALSRAEQMMSREKEKFVAMNQEWDKHVKSFEKDLKAAEGKLRSRDAEMTSLRQHLVKYEDLEQEREEHGKLIAEQCRVIEELQGELAELEAEREHRAELATCNEDLRRDFEELNMKLEETEQGLQDVEQEKRNQLDKLRDLEETLHFQESVITSLKQGASKSSELQQKFGGLASKCDQLSETLTLREDELCKLKDRLEKASQENLEMRDGLNTASKQNRELKEKLEKASHETKEMKNNWEGLSENNNNLKERVDELSTENVELNSTVDRLVKENQQLRGELECVHSENDKLQICVEELQVACNQKDQELDTVRESAVESQEKCQRLEAGRQSLECELEVLKCQLSSQKLEMDSTEIEHLKKDLTFSKDAVAQLERDLSVSHTAHGELEVENNRLKEGLSHVQEDYRDQIGVMSKRLQDMTAKYSASERKARQLESQIHSAKVDKMAKDSMEVTKITRSRDIMEKLEKLEARFQLLESAVQSQDSEKLECERVEGAEAAPPKSLSVPGAKKSSYSHLMAKLNQLDKDISRKEQELFPVSSLEDAVDEYSSQSFGSEEHLRTAESVIRQAQVALENLIQELRTLDLESEVSTKTLRERLIGVQKLLGTECGNSSFELGLVERLLQTWSKRTNEVRDVSLSTDSREDKLKLFAQKLAFETIILGEMAHILHSHSSQAKVSESLSERLSSLEDDSLSNIFPALVERIQLQGEVSDIFEELSNLISADVKTLHSVPMSAFSKLATHALASTTVDKNIDKLHEALQDCGFSVTGKAVMQAELLLGLRHMKHGCQQRVATSSKEPCSRDGLELIYDAVQLEETQKLAEKIIDQHLESHIATSCGDKSDMSLTDECKSRLENIVIGAKLNEQKIVRESVIKRYTDLEEKAVRLETAGVILKDYLRGLSEFAADVVREGLHRAEVTYIRQKLWQTREDAIQNKELEMKCRPDDSSTNNTIQSLTMQSSLNIASIRGRYEQLLETERAEFAKTLAQMQSHVRRLEQQRNELQEDVSSVTNGELCASCLSSRTRVAKLEEEIAELQQAASKKESCQKCKDSSAKLEVVELLLQKEGEKVRNCSRCQDYEGQMEKLQKRLHNEVTSLRERHDIEVSVLKKELQETREKLRLVSLENIKETNSVAELTEQVYAKEDELSELRATIDDLKHQLQENSKVALQQVYSGTNDFSVYLPFVYHNLLSFFLCLPFTLFTICLLWR